MKRDHLNLQKKPDFHTDWSYLFSVLSFSDIEEAAEILEKQIPLHD